MLSVFLYKIKFVLSLLLSLSSLALSLLSTFLSIFFLSLSRLPRLLLCLSPRSRSLSVFDLRLSRLSRFVSFASGQLSWGGALSIYLFSVCFSCPPPPSLPNGR